MMPLNAQTQVNSAVPEDSHLNPRQLALSLNMFSGRWLKAELVAIGQANHQINIVVGSMKKIEPRKSRARLVL